MQRRDFGIALGLGLVCCPLGLLAQPRTGKVVRLAVIGSADSSTFANLLKSLPSALREMGYVEGNNLVIESRNAQGDYGRLAELADDVVRSKVDIIVTTGTDAARAAQKATTTIPIVMLGVADPVGSGLAKSLARPGGNSTGFSGVLTDLIGKRLELLQAVAPKLTRVGVLMNPSNMSHPLILQNATEAAKKIGVTLLAIDARTAQEIERAFDTMIEHRVQALSVLPDPFFSTQRRQLAELALKHQLPSVGSRAYAVSDLLMGYGQAPGNQIPRAAIFIDKILKGTKPADLPIEQPMRFELLVNAKTANALKLTLPPEIVLRADRMIE